MALLPFGQPGIMSRLRDLKNQMAGWSAYSTVISEKM